MTTQPSVRPSGAGAMPVRHDLACSAASGPFARSAARAACCAWSVPDCAAEVGAVAYELVRNAVQHAGSAPVMTIARSEQEIVVGVRDGLRCPPPGPRLSTADDPGGWGLWVVTALASRWGVDEHDDGKTVWAAVTVVPSQPSQPS
jgi:anti-sigma regulatory factor (Ser/Thr protein kinase)